MICITSERGCTTGSLARTGGGPPSDFRARHLYGICTDLAPDHVPPPMEFDPFTEAEELDRGQGVIPVKQKCDKCVRRGSEPRALDTTVIIGTPEHGPGALFSFMLDRTGQLAQGILETHLVSPYRMSPPDCTHCLLMTTMRCANRMNARLKLEEARLSDEHISLTWCLLLVGAEGFDVPAFRAEGYDVAGV
ncbi:hypothetical protein JCGZ_18181 [Jatropha curcas]|uniref:Uncharacterized protein n=1 Tax=Jatropha curcas TaxID=180498 RepID=A0A067LAQ7_JATCU|nr:hypothetical protein JCGZ_18181 [Jatropha curcas]